MKTLNAARILGFGAALAALPAMAQITLYEHDNFGGRTFRSDTTVANLDNTGFNDKTSSVKVQRGQWQLCSDANFRGQCVTLNPGEYASLGDMGLNDKVSSLRQIRGAYEGGWNNSGGNAYNPSSTGKLTGRDTGHCRLINVSLGRDLYNGVCQMKQTVDSNQNKFSFRMGNAAPFVFTNRGGSWEYVPSSGGAEPARYKDLGQSAVFRWGEFRLEVDEDL